MSDTKERKFYTSTIGSGRLLNIKVILNEQQVVYEGRVEDAPDEIKQLRYTKVEGGSAFTYYV